MSNRKGLLLAIIVIIVGLSITAGSYAFWSWASNNNKSVSFNTAKALKNYIVYDEGDSQFSGDFKVSNTYTEGINSTITISKTSEAANVEMNAIIHMDINQIGTNMKSSNALKWVVTEGNALEPGTVLAQGNFIGTNNGDTLTLLPNIEVTTTPTEYTIWIWLDASANPNDALTGETLDTNVWTEINQVEGTEDRFEITRIGANYQNISATVVDSKYKVTHYAVVPTGNSPSTWTSIGTASNIYNLNTSVDSAGTYDVYFKDENNRQTHKSVTVSSVDNTAPSCTWGSFSVSQIKDGVTSNIELTCLDNESDITVGNLTISDITKSNNSINITNITKTTVSHGYKYTITVTGTENDGDTTLTLTANKVKNAVVLGNTTVTSGVILVRNDATPPTVSVSAEIVNSKIRATVTAEDTGSGLSTPYGWNISTSSACDNTVSFTEYPDNYHDFDITDSATYYICVRVKDQSNNTAYASTSILIKSYLRLLNRMDNLFKENLYKDKITTVNFVNYIDLTNAIENKNPYILDEYNSGMIQGWLELNDAKNDTYDLYIGTNNSNIYGRNLTKLFYSMKNLSAFNFSALNTSEVEDMSMMFSYVGTDITNFNLHLDNDFDTSNVVNMYGMFSSAGDNATNFNLTFGDNFNVSKVSDMSKMFQYAGTNATNFNLDLGNSFNVSNVLSMSEMFQSVGANATNFNLNFGTIFNASKATNMYRMFMGCCQHTSNLILSDNFYVRNATNMVQMFSRAGYNATSFTLQLGNNFDTSNVTNMDSMFWYTGGNATNFSLNLGTAFNTINVTNMSYMFAGAGRQATSFDLNLGNNFITTNVTNMARMFNEFSLSVDSFELDLNNKFNTSNVTNMGSMFSYAGYNATNFSLNLGNQFNTINVTNMSLMLYRAGDKATNFNLNLGNNFDTSNVTNMDSMFSGVGSNATNFSLNLGDKFDTGNVVNPYYLFQSMGYNSTNFSLHLGNNFNASKAERLYETFQNIGFNSTNFYLNLGDNFNLSSCNSLELIFKNLGNNATSFYLDLGNNFNAKNVRSMRAMFQNTGQYASNFTLNLGNNFNTSNVTNMASMFSNIGQRATNFNLDLGNQFNTINVVNMYCMFSAVGSNCSNFSLNLGNQFNTINVTNMASMFDFMGRNATTLNFNLGNNFDTSNVTNMYRMFAWFKTNTSNYNLNLSDKFDTSNVTSMSYMFFGAGNNAIDFNLNLGNLFNTSKVTGMFSMFNNAGYNATNFNLDLGNNFVTSNVTTMSSMFNNAGYNATNFNIDLGEKFDTSKVKNMNNIFLGMGYNTKTRFILNLSVGNFNNVTNYVSAFSYFPYNYSTIYVKDKLSQDWVIAKNTYFSANRVLTYNANYYLDGGEFETEPEYFVKERSTPYNVPRPIKNGYTFAGWTGSNGDTPVLDLVIPAGTNDIVKYYTHWIPTKYTITYSLDGGSMINKKDTYIITETFTLNIPYKDGYIFEGWTGSNGDTPEMQVIIPAGTYGNLTYTAHYRTPNNEAERTLAKLHKLGGTGAISTVAGTISGTCPAVDANGNMTVASIDGSVGRLCNAIDDYGTSLVFRGNVDNNYVRFGTNTVSGNDIYWRIIRINGDGSIRMIYEGERPYANSNSYSDNNNRSIGLYKYNALTTDNAYAGYMYGEIEHITATGSTTTHASGTTRYYQATKPTWDPVNGYYTLSGTGIKGSNLTTDYIGYYTMNNTNNDTTGVTYYKVTDITGTGDKTVTYETYSRASHSVAEAQENIYSSTVKCYVDDWYSTKTNLSSLSSSISDTLFCNDRSISEFVTDQTGMGYGSTTTNYRYYYNPWSTSPNINKPNLKCSNQNDRFTVSDTTIGNGDLTYPIALITADEAIAAGGYNATNDNYYLRNYKYTSYATMTPVSNTTTKSIAQNGNVNSNTNYNSISYIRPVINIKVDSLLSGYGSMEFPFATTSTETTSFLITYNLNSGTLSNPINSYTPQSATFTLNNPTRVGYTFAGWTGSNGDTPEVTVTIENGSSGNKWYTANWTANDYTVTLSSIGADSHGTTSTTVTYYSTMPEIEIPEKANNAFVGYYTDENGAGTQYYSYQGRSTRIWNIADNTTLYAHFIPSVITLDEQSPTTSGTTSVNAILNDYLPSIIVPQKDGYYFFGYYTETDCAGTKYIDKDGSGVTTWTATSPTTLYACWSEPIKPKDKWAEEAETTNGYLFSGTTVYNYITFSNTSFRIIGIFDNRLKIMRTSSYSSQYYNSTAGNNVWSTVSLKTYLNGTFYNSLTADAKAMISAYPFKVGSCAVAITASAAQTCIATLTDSAIVGLMDIADYGMSSSSCKGGSYNISAYNTNECKNSTWMAMNEWTLTPVLNSTTNAVRKYSYNANSVAVNTSMSVRPVVYLNEDVYITGGSGKQSDPYMLEIIDNVGE